MQIPKELGRGWGICYVNWGCVRGGAEMSSVGDRCLASVDLVKTHQKKSLSLSRLCSP